MVDEMPDIDERIVRLLTNQDEPISTYRVANEVDVSWSTANTHLKDLQIEGMVESKEVISKGKKSRVWWVEQETLDKFLSDHNLEE